MQTTIFTFATDLLDEGIEAVVENVQQRGGLRGVTLAAAYHSARDIFPHNPRHKVRFLPAGALYFQPELPRYAALRIRPTVSPLIGAADPLDQLLASCAARDLAFDAWTVFLHTDRLEENEECAPRNAFGDRYLTDLCPANPDVRAFALALTGDLASRGVDQIVAESLHFHPLEHGYHHERYFVKLDGRTRFLLGLCFCDHCLTAAGRSGVDGPEVARAVRIEIERAFAGGVGPGADQLDRGEVATIASGALDAYLDVRTATVTSLACDVANVAESNGSALAFIDPSGAVAGYATGRPTVPDTPSLGWRFGIDLPAIAAGCHRLDIAAYVADSARVRHDLDSYRMRAGDVPIGAVLRPGPPDSASAEDLAEKVAVLREEAVAQVGFYHYGLMPLSALDWIKSAVAC